MVTKVSDEGEKPLSKLLQELRGRIIIVSISVIIAISICMTMSITIYNFGGYKIPILFPDSLHSISVQIILFMRDTLLPKSVILIQVTPGQAFSAQIYVAMIVGLIISLPIMYREIIAFVGPALHFHERRVIKNIAFPSIFLFAAGCFFSYYIVLPYTIEFLYRYGQAMDVESFFEITQFISFSMLLLLASGFSYQFPLLMWVLTKTKVVKPRFWRNNIRYFVIILVIFGAVITPDGSGVTMWFVIGPMLLLYAIGTLVVELRLENSFSKKDNTLRYW
jgi:sec-independent protein translocase protein TatC